MLDQTRWTSADGGFHAAVSRSSVGLRGHVDVMDGYCVERSLSSIA
jgi:hypothetical protein